MNLYSWSELIPTAPNALIPVVGRIGLHDGLGELLGVDNHKVHSLVAGGSHIDNTDMLRSGNTGRVLSFRVAASSTLGTFLRSSTIGHVRQLDRVIAEALKRVWALGVRPGDGRLVVDVDSTVTEVFGYQRQGAVYGYTKQKGYHPLIASSRAMSSGAGTGEGAAKIREAINRGASDGAPPYLP